MTDALEWDYTSLARSYHKRPNYPEKIIDAILNSTNLRFGDHICDIGAGTGNLSLLLAEKGLNVKALEPNLAMYNCRVKGARSHPSISWENTTAEHTMQTSDTYDAISFGSSFNVVNQVAALRESCRICKPGAWLMTIWNHRDLGDPIQNQIETIIKNHLPDYDYGLRRRDQREYLVKTDLFSQIDYFECAMLTRQSAEDILKAWRSHATLKRQAGKGFNDIVQEIARVLRYHDQGGIDVPYTSRAWVSQFHKQPA